MFTKLAIHDCRHLRIFERLVRHDVAPVAGRITDREKDRFVFLARFGERFFAPRIPIDRIVRVLEKIRRLLAGQPICVLGNFHCAFSSHGSGRHRATFLSFRMKSRNLSPQIRRKFHDFGTMDATHLSFLFLAVGIIAFLYSSVGHAGASGYIAVMALWGLSAPTIRPTALILNILVATIGSFQFWKGGHFSWKLFWPFALLSIPAAYLGGYLQLPAAILKALIGLVLIFSAIRLIFRRADPATTNPPTLPVALGTGGAIGFLSGLTGTGGGIFLTPALLFFQWAKIRQAAAVSALFILLNSISGLVGYFSAHHAVPSLGFVLAPAVIVCGGLGSYLGSRRFPVRTISLLLAAVLLIAGLKLIFTR